MKVNFEKSVFLSLVFFHILFLSVHAQFVLLVTSCQTVSVKQPFQTSSVGYEV